VRTAMSKACKTQTRVWDWVWVRELGASEAHEEDVVACAHRHEQGL
jgi:hypothetical protein